MGGLFCYLLKPINVLSLCECGKNSHFDSTLEFLFTTYKKEGFRDTYTPAKKWNYIILMHYDSYADIQPVHHTQALHT